MQPRHQHGADRGRGAQRAQALRPDVQDLVGEDRQDRDRAAEQHREQVQRDRAQEDRPREQEGEALAHAGDQRLLRARRRAGAPARGCAPPSPATPPSAPPRSRTTRVGPTHGIEDAAQRRTGDGGDLPDAGAPGDGAREQRARDQLGAQRVARRQQEAARRAADDDDRVDDALDQRARAPAAGREEQRAGDGQRRRRRRTAAPAPSARRAGGRARRRRARRRARTR